MNGTGLILSLYELAHIDPHVKNDACAMRTPIVVSKAVTDVPEVADRDTVDLRFPAALVTPLVLIENVGGIDGDVVPHSRQLSRELIHNTGDAAISPHGIKKKGPPTIS
jgi:hypothetical protein